MAAVVTALAVVIFQQLGQLLRGRNPLLFLRTEFWHDQLGYLAIAADVANGHFDNTEPVTTTGISHYPRLYYSVVGVVGRVFGLPTVVSWNLTSFALQFFAALSVSLVAATLARRWWVAFAGFLPFFTGTFAYLMAGGSEAWYTPLSAHAVLWGPFGALFSNNAETAGLCVGIIALSALVWAWRGQSRRGVRIAVTIVAPAAIGMLSSFQTYSFLSLTYLLVFGAAVAGLVAARRRLWPIVISIALIAVVFAVGPLLADRVGQLPTLVFGMLPAAPGLVIAIARSRGLVAIAAAAAAATALPQIAYTMLGLLGGDPFLAYRVGSNHLLGVVSWQAVGGAAVVLTALVGVVVTASLVRDRLALIPAVTALVALPLLAVNDVWGANAEPYRFWIEGILLGSVLAVLCMARLVGILWRGRERAVLDEATAHGEQGLDVDGGVEPTHAKAAGGRRSGGTRAGAIALVATIVASGVLWGAALPDWVNSVRDGAMQAAWDPYTERENAIAAVARGAADADEGGLLTTELCVDSRTVKANTGLPIANYHLGMAWPENRDAIDEIMTSRNADELDIDAMRESDTRWVLTDSGCGADWDARYADEMERVTSQDYRLAEGEQPFAATSQDGTITLWRLRE